MQDSTYVLVNFVKRDILKLKKINLNSIFFQIIFMLQKILFYIDNT